MNKTIKAIESGRVVQYNSNPPRYYKMNKGIIFYSDRNGDHNEWKQSNSTTEIFYNEMDWIIL